jgi:hypothetical protein
MNVVLFGATGMVGQGGSAKRVLETPDINMTAGVHPE